MYGVRVWHAKSVQARNESCHERNETAMIFQHTLAQVIQQRKQQTRRVISPGEVAVRGRYNKIIAVTHNGRKKWVVGRTYAVQPGRGQAQVARIRITGLNSEYVTRIRTQDAIAEGFDSRADFLQTWTEIHGQGGLSCRVWVVQFELAKVIDANILDINFTSDKNQELLAYVY